MTAPSPIKTVLVDSTTGEIVDTNKPSIATTPQVKQPGWGHQQEMHLTRAKIVKNSKRAQAMLEKLGFDPITRLVEQYERITTDICEYDRLRRDGPDVDDDGKIIRKFSSMAYVALLTIQQKLIVELLPYGYAKQPSAEDGGDGKEIPRMQIILTPKGGNAEAMAKQTYSGNTYEVNDA